MKNLIILTQALIIIYILQTAIAKPVVKANRTPSVVFKGSYSDLIEELRGLRRYNFEMCFTKLEVRDQNEYCWGYQILDVVLHNKAEDLIDEIIKEREESK